MVSTRHRPSPSMVAENKEPNKEVENDASESREENAANASNIKRNQEVDPPPSAKRKKVVIEKDDKCNHSTSVGEVEKKISSETFEFDKAKAVEKINAIVQKQPNIEDQTKIPNMENESKAIKAAFANMETIYKEIQELRTNEVEQLLADTRATAEAKEQSQQALIEELQARVEFLQHELNNSGPSEEALKKEIAQLREENAKLAKGVAEGSTGDDSRRRAVKFHIANEDKKTIEFQPIGNKHLLPPELQEVSLFKSSEAPLLISRIVESLNV